MKQTLFILLTLCIFSCGKNDSCTEVTLGENIRLADMDLICINDVEYTFEAKDERCACGTECVWEGEFVLTFLDSDDNVVYTFNESREDNPSPPFGESLVIESIENQVPDCGDDSKIDEVRFTLLIQ